MRRELLLKKIVEDLELSEKYWPEFDIDSRIEDYKSVIKTDGNRYLKAVMEIIYEEKTTSRTLYKKILNLFEI
ncbi:MAG: hypothetical protein OXC92_08940 [Flavobacteriaceae bacterium]|nr:hypothetical protein [Flavobacteriaceae bacterium]